MDEPITYVGIDAHARELHLAMLRGDASAAASSGPRPMSRARSSACGGDSNARRQARSNAVMKPGRPAMRLQRRLTAGRVRCRVIAPSLIPEKPGDRIKTDRRDARKLAQLLRADLLTTIQPPSEDGGSGARSDSRAR